MNKSHAEHQAEFTRLLILWLAFLGGVVTGMLLGAAIASMSMLWLGLLCGLILGFMLGAVVASVWPGTPTERVGPP